MKRTKLYFNLIFALIIQGGQSWVIRKKNRVLEELSLSVNKPEKFLDRFFREDNESLFDPWNAKFPATYDTKRLMREMTSRTELLNKIVSIYYKKGCPDWIYNLLEHILPPESLHDLAISDAAVLAQNEVCLKLLESVDDPELFGSILYADENIRIFKIKITGLLYFNELRNEIAKRTELLHKIALAYYQGSDLESMDNLLSLILSWKARHKLPTIAKDAVLIDLEEMIRSSEANNKNFLSKLRSRENKFIFDTKNAKFPPTYDTGTLKCMIDEFELFDALALEYHEQCNPEWMSNLFGYILSPKSMHNLETSDVVALKKDAVLVDLNELVTTPESFLEKLFDPATAEVFALSNKDRKPTYNTRTLEEKIHSKPELLKAIINAYYKNAKPEWIMEILKPILRASDMEELEKAGPKIFCKNDVLNKLFLHIENPKSFIDILLDSFTAKAFAKANSGFLPTLCTRRLKDAIDEKPELYKAIITAYEEEKPEWMMNALEHILSATMFNVFEKDVMLSKLATNTSKHKSFIEALSAPKNAKIFGLEYPPTYDTSGLRAAIEENHALLFNMIIVTYNKEDKPKWMRNLLGYVLSEQRMDELETIDPVVAYKNGILIRLAQNVAKPREFIKMLCMPNNEKSFISENQSKEPTYDATEVWAAMAERYELVREIASLYYRQKKPVWMMNMLEHILPQKIIEALPALGKDALLHELYEASKCNSTSFKNKLVEPGNALLFGPDNQKFPPNSYPAGLQDAISKNDELFDIIHETFAEKHKPRWMMNMLPYLLTIDKLMKLVSFDESIKLVDLDDLLEHCGLSKLFEEKGVQDPLSGKELAKYLKEPSGEESKA